MKPNATLLLAAAAWALVAASRAALLAPDTWEWDEILFTNAVRDGIDLRLQRPHAPGYPLFVETGRALTRLGLDPFRGATVAGAVGGAAAPAALSALLLALGTPLAWSVAGGALYAFVPAVWLHAARPLSDAPAAAALLASAAAFVASRSKDDGRLLMAGSVLAGLSFALRPQAALALLPLAGWAALSLVRHRRPGAALAAAAAGAATTALCYLPAITGSGGWTSFRTLVVRQAAYVRAEDSLHLADFFRGDTWERWLRDPFGPAALAWVFLLLALAGFLAFPRQGLALCAVFVPLAALTIPFSSLQAAPRYAIVLLPFPCALAALALAALARRSRLASALAGAGLVGVSAAVAAPAVCEVATRPSPPVAAFRALRDDPAFGGRPLIVWTGLAQHRRAFLPDRPAREIREDAIAPVSARDLIVMSDDAVFGQAPIRRFAFESPLLLRISRARFLNVSIVSGDPGVGVLRPWLDGKGDFDWSTGDARLAPGDVLTVRGPTGPVVVHVEAAATPRAATLLTILGERSSRRFALGSAETRILDFPASPGRENVLFRLAVEDGPALLTGWRFRAGSAP